MTEDVTFKSAKILYADPYLKVEKRRYRFQERKYKYLVKDEPDFAVVGAVTEEGDILLVRQFRPGPGKYTLDLPGGMVDYGDSAEETARKELLEETGYEGELEAVTTSFVTAYSTARKYIFIARNCRKVAEPEEDENVIGMPVLLSRDEFSKLLRSGDMLDLDAALLLANAIDIPY